MIETRYLRRIENGISIPAVATPRTFQNGKGVLGTYPSYLNRLCAGAIIAPTESIIVSIYETMMPTFWSTALQSFGVNIEKFFFRNPNHVLAFYELLVGHFHPEGWGTFFPFAVESESYMIGHWHLKTEGRCTSIKELGTLESSHVIGKYAQNHYVIIE